MHNAPPFRIYQSGITSASPLCPACTVTRLPHGCHTADRRFFLSFFFFISNQQVTAHFTLDHTLLPISFTYFISALHTSSTTAHHNPTPSTWGVPRFQETRIKPLLPRILSVLILAASLRTRSFPQRWSLPFKSSNSSWSDLSRPSRTQDFRIFKIIYLPSHVSLNPLVKPPRKSPSMMAVSH